MTWIGSVKAASVAKADGTAVLLVEGEFGEAEIEIPAHMVAPMQDTIRQAGLVYGEHTLLSEGSQ